MEDYELQMYILCFYLLSNFFNKILAIVLWIFQTKIECELLDMKNPNILIFKDLLKLKFNVCIFYYKRCDFYLYNTDHYILELKNTYI